MQHEALVEAGGQQLRMLAKDLYQMLAEALRIGHARCVVLFIIERHTETLSSGWFHSVPPYGAGCSIHSMGPEVESSYCLHRLFTNHEIRWTQEFSRQPFFYGKWGGDTVGRTSGCASRPGNRWLNRDTPMSTAGCSCFNGSG